MAPCRFAINTNVSSTTKFSPFLMFGRQPRYHSKWKKLCSRPKIEGGGGRGGAEGIDWQAAELTSEDALQDYIDKMPTTRNVLFSRVQRNITIAQGKQKRQYQKRKGGMNKSFKKGDVVRRHNFHALEK